MKYLFKQEKKLKRGVLLFITVFMQYHVPLVRAEKEVPRKLALSK